MKKLFGGTFLTVLMLIFASGADAQKPTDGQGIFIGNGFPSGSHFNLNVIAMKAQFTCPQQEFLCALTESLTKRTAAIALQLAHALLYTEEPFSFPKYLQAIQSPYLWSLEQKVQKAIRGQQCLKSPILAHKRLTVDPPPLDYQQILMGMPSMHE